MTVRKTVGTVGTLAQEAVSTAVSVARHPIGSTALVAGLVKGAAQAGVGLVRGTVSAPSGTPTSETLREDAPAEQLAPEAEAPTPEPEQKTGQKTEQKTERDLPGPDLAHFEPPRPEDLPEPIVIVADDAGPGNGESGEPFHHEPKVASREVEHGEPGTDFEQADGFADEIPEDLEVGRQS